MKRFLSRGFSLALLLALTLVLVGIVAFVIMRGSFFTRRITAVSEHRGIAFSINEQVMNAVFEDIGVWRNPMRTFIDEPGKRQIPPLQEGKTRVVFVLAKTPQSRQVQIMNKNDKTVMISGRASYNKLLNTLYVKAHINDWVVNKYKNEPYFAAIVSKLYYRVLFEAFAATNAYNASSYARGVKQDIVKFTKLP